MKVKKEMLLMDYLLLSYNRKNAKNLLKYKQVYVNNQQISQFDYLLHENDRVEIKKENTSSLEILYEDQEFVVINKPSGLLSMSDGKEKEKTAYHYVSEYLKKQDRKQKVFIVHRLDRETSGVLMFCKNEKIRDLLQKDWNKIVYLRGYMALVEGKGLKNGTLKNYLAESRSQQVYVTSKEKGKLAITHYKAIKEIKNQTLLEIQLDTGRKNQIRVQLSNIHHPIVLLIVNPIGFFSDTIVNRDIDSFYLAATFGSYSHQLHRLLHNHQKHWFRTSIHFPVQILHLQNSLDCQNYLCLSVSIHIH